jgi:hypothetical protein
MIHGLECQKPAHGEVELHLQGKTVMKNPKGRRICSNKGLLLTFIISPLFYFVLFFSLAGTGLWSLVSVKIVFGASWDGKRSLYLISTNSPSIRHILNELSN